VILTDDNPRHEDGLAIVREIQAGMQRPERSQVMRDRAEAIRLAIREAGPDDVVLVAGKGHEQEQVIGDTVRPFSDFDAVRAALEAAA
jgi:UDP-N-acetylmuramoyl-L-alanyl-D-glutamate--2,6-diaminopimelate ligase